MKRVGITLAAAVMVSAVLAGSALSAPQQGGRMGRGGMYAMQSGTTSGSGQGTCAGRGQTSGGLMNSGTFGGLMNSQMGTNGMQSSAATGTTQLTVAPVRNSTELAQLVNLVQTAVSASSVQVKPTGDGQSAVVAISGGQVGSTLAQALQSSGFQILEIAVQGSGRGTSFGQQSANVNAYGGMAAGRNAYSGTGAVTKRVQYGTAAAAAAQYAASMQARTIQQYRAAVQGRYR